MDFKHLIVSPFSFRNRINRLIKNEIKNAQSGKESFIYLKVNGLVDPQIIDKLYEANQAGVEIRLNVRGMFCLVTGIEGLSDKIEGIGILDKFLEHSRIFIFCNGGDEKYYISSADWMTRNIDRRIEVTCPVYDKEIQSELRELLNIQLKDNTRARKINETQDNQYKKEPKNFPVRIQTDFYNFMKEKVDKITS